MSKAQVEKVLGTTAQAYLVDDDGALREALSFLLRSRGVAVSNYGSAEAFLESFNHAMRGCIVTDVRMQGLSGLEMFDRLEALHCRLPAIVLTGHGNVAMAVNSLQKGVRDFVEKPFNTNNLVDKIIAAIADDEKAAALESERDVFLAALASLSGREREVMALLLAGKLNKIIADELDISMRTVEVHRARIFSRMGVRSAVELANLNSRMNGEAKAGRG